MKRSATAKPKTAKSKRETKAVQKVKANKAPAKPVKKAKEAKKAANLVKKITASQMKGKKLVGKKRAAPSAAPNSGRSK